jgi:uncharacterized membrane protein HdeD (DUF308 family)
VTTIRLLAGTVTTAAGFVLMAASTPPVGGHWSLVAVAMIVAGGALLAHAALDLLGVE